MAQPTFGELLQLDGVVERCELRGPIGFMAYHGGGLEEMTDVIAEAAAAASGASYYGVVHPPDWDLHLPSIKVRPDESETLRGFVDHVDTVVTIHGFGRRALMTSLLLGGRNRELATHLAGHLRRALPAYDVLDDLDAIPKELRGIHERNPVNLPPQQGVQIELPPRVRGSSPMWWDWEGGLTPHTEALIDALAAAARTWGAEEAVEWVDEHDRVIAVVPRSRMRRENLRHRSAAVVVLSTDGQRLLVHRRAETKDLRPGWWDVCAGGVLAVGESYRLAARRELAEELGITDAELEPLGGGRFDDDDSKEISEVFLARHDGPVHFADREVAEARFVDRAELTDLMNARRFLPTCRGLVLPLVPGFAGC